jgi:hypothetical protein
MNSGKGSACLSDLPKDTEQVRETRLIEVKFS